MLGPELLVQGRAHDLPLDGRGGSEVCLSGLATVVSDSCKGHNISMDVDQQLYAQDKAAAAAAAVQVVNMLIECFE